MKPITVVSSGRSARAHASAPPLCRNPAELVEQSSQMVAQLGRHLELDPLLMHFSRLAGEYVPHDSLSFRHEFAGSERAVVVGATARNMCSYQLTVEDTRLGTLSLSRRRRFDESELHTVEQLLGVVVYPLRNALLYYRALHDAATDRLTGLANRGVFLDSLAREISRAQRYGSNVALLMADLDNLKRKIDAGATRAITQFFFDNDVYFRFLDKARARGITIPIVPGIMPIRNFKQVANFAAKAGASVPRWVAERFEGLDEDQETRALVAATTAVEQVMGLARAGVEEFHFYTNNRADMVFAICHLLGVRPLREKADA